MGILVIIIHLGITRHLHIYLRHEIIIYTTWEHIVNCTLYELLNCSPVKTFMIQYYSTYVPAHRFNSTSLSLFLVVTILYCIISLPSDFFFFEIGRLPLPFCSFCFSQILFLVSLVHLLDYSLIFILLVHTPSSVPIQTFKEINLLKTAIRPCRLLSFSKLSNRLRRTRFMRCPLTIYNLSSKNISDGIQNWRCALAPFSTTWNSRSTYPHLPSNFAHPISSSSS